MRIILFIAIFFSFSLSAFGSSYISRQFKAGDNLISLLKAHGFTESERKVILSHKSLHGVIFLTDAYYLFKKAKGKVELRIHNPYEKSAHLIVKTNGKVKVQKYIPTYKVTYAQFSGTMGYSLLESIQNKTGSTWVASRFLDAYKIDGKSFKKLPKGTTYSLTVEKKYEHGKFVRYGEVINTALNYNGRRLSKKFVTFGDGGFFISANQAREKKKLYAPVNYIRLASLFQSSRLHPVKKTYQAHLGVDFELPEGSPVLAAKTGKVIRKGYNRAAGNYVILDHGSGIETAYNHLQSISSRVRIGKKVRAGEHIGAIGCTGYCTKAHLHFAYKKQGKMIDPLPHMRPYAAPAEAYIASF